MQPRFTRRRFLKLAGASAGTLFILSCKGAPAPTAPPSGGAATEAPVATAVPAPTEVPPTAVPAGPKVLRVAIGADMTNMDPAFYIAEHEGWVFSCVFSGLVRYGANSSDVVNDLAESITPSEDGKTVEFTIKKGVQWQKGYGEVTANDVKFSYERIADKANKSPYASDWSSLDHVEVTDDYSGKIVMKEPYAPLWTSTMPVTSGLIVCKKYFDEVGQEQFALAPVGCGPYIFEEWRPKDRVILKRNPDFYGTHPGFDEIDFIYVADPNASSVALDAKELDFSSVSFEDLPRYEGSADWKTLKQNGLAYSWIGMNMEHPKLQDINVRQAIRLALDVPSMLTADGQDPEAQAFTLISPALLGSWTDAPHYDRDVAKAKEFMAKAGVTTLDLRFDCQAGAGGGNPLAEVLQQNLKDIGINVTINPMDSTAFWSMDETRSKATELFYASYTMMPDPAWATEWFTCDQINIWNWMRWCSTEYDDLHKQGMVTMDRDKRAEIYVKMQQLWDAACHTKWLSYSQYLYVYAPTVKPATYKFGIPQYHYFEPA